MSRLNVRPIISLVTDRRTMAAPLVDLITLVTLITAAARAGVDLIQIRERDLDDRTLVALAREAVSAVRGTAARVLVNDRIDIALAAGAAGVHLRADSVSARRARSLVGEGFVIGRSVHGVDEATAAQREGGVDYLTFGTVFPSAGKPADHRYAGVDGLRAVCRSVSLPVIAIGGVTCAAAGQIAAAGAEGVAAIGLFSEAVDLPATVARLRHAFDT